MVSEFFQKLHLLIYASQFTKPQLLQFHLTQETFLAAHIFYINRNRNPDFTTYFSTYKFYEGYLPEHCNIYYNLHFTQILSTLARIQVGATHGFTKIAMIRICLPRLIILHLLKHTNSAMKNLEKLYTMKISLDVPDSCLLMFKHG